MLILARAIDEAIVIGSCRVSVPEVVRRKQGRIRVKLGIEAPREVPIRRAELSPRPSEKQSRPAMPPATGASPAGTALWLTTATL